ncbi:AMP-binding protein [Gordonia sp. (in: high G+C Gram-positive bacteria)]|jgi:long-chain acyl-CoA synthetase|uniref:AMP-binding protein n=1 Tax=Gordonia sp. (in: high G+C Gram-positive bacteria) TaxID=84139 RepID=UPI001DDA0DE4|nr:AMP-binding protein [Gordonia sp. (in: high G+C Gram-positive bacteria)]MCB1294041.1 AMP-binding protein [Gordonia sp. (in: high G+C Gram-positive bacteria)]
MTSLSDPVFAQAAADPEQEAARGAGTVLTYQQLADATLAYAGMLADIGIEPGDRVLFIAPTLPEFVVAYLGINAAGAIIVPVNPLCTPSELGYYISDAGCKLVIAWDSVSQAAREAAEAAGIEFLALAHGAQADRGTPLTEAVDRGEDEVGCILYTSGTTGKPKGAELTIGNLTSAARIAIKLGGTAPNDRIATALPLFHVFGQASVLLASIGAGCPMSLAPTFHPQQFIEMIIEDRATLVEGVPTMWNAMLHSSQDTPADAFEHLRLAVSGGASLPLEVREAFHRRFECKISEGYGMTETCAIATFSKPGTEAPAGTVGPAAPEMEVEIRLADGTPAPVGGRGEVFVRGPVVMRGYWNRPEATAETISPDGWLRTGDIAEMDDEGNVRIVDRAKDLIIRGGYNVYPSEIEEVLYAHPDIVEAAVVGVPDPHYGEEIVAVVAIGPDAELSADDVKAWTAERLAAYKHPRAVMFVDALPKGPSGKILKRSIERAPLEAAVAEYRAARAAAHH